MATIAIPMFEGTAFAAPEDYAAHQLQVPQLATNDPTNGASLMHSLFSEQHWDLIPGNDYSMAGTVHQRAWQWQNPFAAALTQQQKADVQTRLEQIARNGWIKYSFALVKTIRIGAETEVLKSKNLGPQERTTRPNGRMSHIKFSESMYHNLARADQVNDVPNQLYQRFHFAITLLHELAHACYNLHETRPQHAEPWVGQNAIVAELGFDLENILFSGHLERMMAAADAGQPPKYWYTHNNNISELRGVLALTEWPYQRLVNEYRENKDRIKVRAGQDPQVAKQRHDLAWRVPISFLQRLFDDNFWATTVPAQGLRALRPVRDLGYCFRAPTSNHSPVRCRANEAAPRCIPVGYARLNNGDVGTQAWVNLQPNPALPRVGRLANASSFDGTAPRAWQKRSKKAPYVAPPAVAPVPAGTAAPPVAAPVAAGTVAPPATAPATASGTAAAGDGTTTDQDDATAEKVAGDDTTAGQGSTQAEQEGPNDAVMTDPEAASGSKVQETSSKPASPKHESGKGAVAASPKSSSGSPKDKVMGSRVAKSPKTKSSSSRTATGAAAATPGEQDETAAPATSQVEEAAAGAASPKSSSSSSKKSGKGTLAPESPQRKSPRNLQDKVRDNHIAKPKPKSKTPKSSPPGVDDTKFDDTNDTTLPSEVEAAPKTPERKQPAREAKSQSPHGK